MKQSTFKQTNCKHIHQVSLFVHVCDGVYNICDGVCNVCDGVYNDIRWG